MTKYSNTNFRKLLTLVSWNLNSFNPSKNSITKNKNVQKKNKIRELSILQIGV